MAYMLEQQRKRDGVESPGDQTDARETRGRCEGYDAVEHLWWEGLHSGMDREKEAVQGKKRRKRKRGAKEGRYMGL